MTKNNNLTVDQSIAKDGGIRMPDGEIATTKAQYNENLKKNNLVVLDYRLDQRQIKLDRDRKKQKDVKNLVTNNFRDIRTLNTTNY